MTWRLQGLIRTAWLAPGARASCESCEWNCERAGVRAARYAREHTRTKGHATRVAQVKITEYRTEVDKEQALIDACKRAEDELRAIPAGNIASIRATRKVVQAKKKLDDYRGKNGK